MIPGRLDRCWLSAIAVWSVCFPLFAADQHSRPRRRVSAPTVRDIDNAFRGKTAEPRMNLHLKLRRAADAADQPELVAVLVKNLSDRIDKRLVDAADLPLISLLGTYACDEAVDGLLSFFRAEDVRVIIVSLQGLIQLDRPPPWSEILPLTRRQEYPQVYALRRCIVAAAQRIATGESIEFLIETVNDVDGQLKYEAAKSLTELTGQRFGGKGHQWRQWWESVRQDFQPIPFNERIAASLKHRMDWDGPLPKFYKLPVYARRVLFMIDRSGSMKATDFEGESRINRARRELETVIAALPGDTNFSIVAFHDSVVSLSPRLLPADEETKRNANLFARSLTAHKNTNCYDALSLALAADPNLEAIYFLSDGQPTTGGIVEPAKIVDAIVVQNQLHSTAIYTLGIGARGDHARFLTELAERNYGEFFSIR